MSLGSIARQSPLYPAFVKTDTFTFSATIGPRRARWPMHQ
jgi:hypothetical protein